MRHLTWIVGVAVVAASCSSKRVHEEPVMGSGDRVSVEEVMPEDGGTEAGDDSIRRCAIQPALPPRSLSPNPA